MPEHPAKIGVLGDMTFETESHFNGNPKRHILVWKDVI